MTPRRRVGFVSNLLLLLGSFVVSLPALGQPKAVEFPALDTLVAHGQDLERQREWRQAADVYERALRIHGESNQVRERWRIAERRHNLFRRYHDTSFVKDLLGLSQDAAIDLYLEVLRKIDSYFVEPVDYNRIVKSGHQQLAAALDEPAFVQRCIKPAYRMHVATVRQLLLKRHWRPVDGPTSTAIAARNCAVEFDEYFVTSSAIIMEFTSAACECLDAYSLHLSPQRLRDLYAAIDGNFVGLGVEVRGHENGLRLVTVLPNSPAAEVGLLENDVIIEVDGKKLMGMPTEEAANLLQGTDGTSVRLIVRRPNVDPLLGTTVVRREVVVNSVSVCERLGVGNKLGYLRLTTFQKQTAHEIRNAVAKLAEQGAVSGLILDLRGNPGGLLDAAVQVADLFLDRGVIVRTKGRAWGQTWTHEAQKGSLGGFPLVVLIDCDSASASEILAGAIKDHDRGTLVGTRSYGKGSVQSIFPLQSVHTGLRLTTARFFSPDGHPFEGKGVDPHVVVRRKCIDPFGEEEPAPRKPNPQDDAQLAMAIQVLEHPTGTQSASK